MNGCTKLVGIFKDYAAIFQFGYVTDDLESAVARFGELGIEQFRISPVGAAADGHSPFGARIAMAWAGELMIEIIEPLRDKTAPVYVDDMPPAESRRCVFNHVGLAVPDHETWNALEKELERRKLPIVWRGSNPARFDVSYVDTRPLLGHYCEFIRICPVLVEQFANVPKNDTVESWLN